MMISNTLVEGHPLTWETKIFCFHRLSFSMKKKKQYEQKLIGEKLSDSKPHLIGDPISSHESHKSLRFYFIAKVRVKVYGFVSAKKSI